MQYHKRPLLLFFILFSLLLIQMAHAGENVCKEPQVDDYLSNSNCDGVDGDHTADSKDGKRAEITNTDGCEVTCTDEVTGNIYTIRGYGWAKTPWGGGEDDEADGTMTIEYEDPDGTITILKTVGPSPTDSLYERGAVASFYYFFDAGEDNENVELTRYYKGNQDLGDYDTLDWDYNRAYYWVNAFDVASYYLWPLYYQSYLGFSQDEVSKRISVSYNHVFDFSTCQDTFLEFYFQSYDGGAFPNLALFTADTGVVDCIMHQDGTETWIRSVITASEEGTKSELDDAYNAGCNDAVCDLSPYRCQGGGNCHK